MLIREANEGDIWEVLNWRNNSETRKMSLQKKKITDKEHEYWFKNKLKNEESYLYIGELNSNKIGICRFDKNKLSKKYDVSVNLNPSFRNRGVGKVFLKAAIDKFELKMNADLIAYIDENNIASKKVFINAGFEENKKKNEVIKFIKKKLLMKFKLVTIKDSEVLYNLLKKRNYSISHFSMPTYENHIKFIKSNPYRYWYLIYLNNSEIGTFYIQNNNSIGINIEQPKEIIIKKIITYVQKKIKPKKSIPSKVPEYYFINVPEKNKKLKKILEKLGCISIQKSFKINS